jgi:uncharacterized protein
MKYWTAPAAGWGVCGLAVVSLLAVVRFVDLSPKVEGEFFFAEDDPQMEASRSVAERFPAGAQIILRVADRGGDSAVYYERTEALTRELLSVPGVESGFSIATDDAVRSPLFARILLTPDSDATNIVLLVDDTDPEVLLPRIERVVEAHAAVGYEVVISGVPVIVELIRRSLYRDLVVFSSAAVLVFALLIGLVYRDPAIVVGTLATCLVSVAATLLLVQVMNVGIGLLTANLVTIVFVLTLSHVIFLTANWRARASGVGNIGVEGVATIDGRGGEVGDGSVEGGHEPTEAGDKGRAAIVRAAVAETWEGSFWSMTTTLLGFASLLIATARPLRELGVAGAVGAATALTVSYLLFPVFLGGWASPSRSRRADRSLHALRGTRWILPTAGIGVVGFALGVPRINTDPGLLSYFAEGTPLRDGLAQIDADGGSSTLDIVVADPSGALVSDGAVFPKLEALQASLEADSAVGVVLSPTVLIEHARTVPLAGLLPVGLLLDLASADALGNVALGYVTPERDVARFSLRMRETSNEPRGEVIDRLREQVRAADLRPVVIAGLYDLQAQLGRLIGSSLRIGIGGLLLLFMGVAIIVARSAPVAALMWFCLAAIPVVILGTFGHARIAIDIITSPAANIALAIGADSMIHLVVRVRRLHDSHHTEPWAAAVSQIGLPVLGASGIIVAGFGIFILSSFPPTQRFGLAVIVGTVTAAAMALLVLPRLACLWAGRVGSLSRPDEQLVVT